MNRFLAVLTAGAIVLVAALLFVGSAAAHTEQPGPPATYCGHYWKIWYVQLPSGSSIRFTESYQWGWTINGIHRHDYDVFRAPYGSAKETYVHSHYGRVCPGHAV